MCCATQSPCPRGLTRFPKLFPHTFSSDPQKKKQCFAKKTNYPNSQKGLFLHRNLQPTRVHFGPNLGQHWKPVPLALRNQAEQHHHVLCPPGCWPGVRMETTRALSGNVAPGNVLGCTYCNCFPNGWWGSIPPFATGRGKIVFFFKQNGDWLDFILNFILHGGKDRNRIPE